MTARWNVIALLDALAARGTNPSVIVAGEGAPRSLDGATLAANVRALAATLRSRYGVRRGTPVGLHAPNGTAWVTASLGILAAGGMLVPFDDLIETAHAIQPLQGSGATLLFTTRAHLDTGMAALRQAGLQPLLLDPRVGVAREFQHWEDLLGEAPVTLEKPAPEHPAALLATSGTTGTPKTFILTHDNIGSNVDALTGLGLIGPTDRVLLPLPLHHAYPLVVGMLTTLTAGSALVLPTGPTGPTIMRAARDGDATVMVGVPRLYDAIATAIESRLEAQPWLLRVIARGALAASAALRQRTGLSLGRALFGAVRRSVAPSLRLLVSGGAKLERSTEERLEALGWMVLSGYGLAETASIFTGNRPERRKTGSAGLPFGEGRVRIAEPDAGGVGEIQLHGPSVTESYVGNPEATRASFTEDRWFRTGDLGYLDSDGYLFVTGRAKEVLVLGGGKKVSPEELERVYGTAPQIQEIAVLEQDGALVALVRPDHVKLREMGATNLRDGIRVVLAERAQSLRSHERLSGFALTDEPLPRTRLGKYRRFLLRELYARALAGHPARAPRPPMPEDITLLADPTAAAIWSLLQQRQPGRELDLDMNPGLDLTFDSFAWMELTVALQERFGVTLNEGEIAGIVSVRDLLRLAVMRRSTGVTLRRPPAIATDIDRWLAPRGVLLTATGLFLYGLNLAAMRGLFRLKVVGLEHVPMQGACVLTPNHVSDLDPLAIAAALRPSRLRRLYWAGDIVRLFSNRASRLFCRAVHLFPVDERHPSSAVDTAERVLAADQAQVWFPEGWRSPDGRLQRFLPGIGQLLLRSGAPAVPVFIAGAFEALPRGRRIPRLRRITVVFGPSAHAADLLAEWGQGSEDERVAAALRERVRHLAENSGFLVEVVDPPSR
ncbi:AMP-binding protein [Elioraea rosea]|uniref:AMP-binding protein n=1 Tax=Elioraea rosea TaxID=2492390 RepID=UPI00118331D9|nr:AMP-binding protein [Elioraea rosea]